MNNKTPKFSIVCPVLNVAPYIGETIDSIINQTYEDWELIVVDGVSTDGTIEIVKHYAEKDFRIRFYSEPDECSWHAFDKGLSLARGEFITTIPGQDGFCDSTWLEECARVFDLNHDVSLVWGLTQLISLDQKIFDHEPYLHFLEKENIFEILWINIKKTTVVLRDILFKGKTRRVLLLKKIFSKTASFRFNVLMKRKFKGGKIPQKEYWFLYWLKTGLPFPDLSLFVDRKIFINLLPRYEKGNKTLGFMTDFFFKFNSYGYLSYHIPRRVAFSHMHENKLSETLEIEANNAYEKYLEQIRNFRKTLRRKHLKMRFLNRKGDVISSIQF